MVFNIIFHNGLFTSSTMFSSLLLPVGDNYNTVTRIQFSSFEANTQCRFSNELTALVMTEIEYGNWALKTKIRGKPDVFELEYTKL